MIPGQLKMGEHQWKCGALPGRKTAVLKVGEVNINPHICNLSYNSAGTTGAIRRLNL